MALLLLGPRLQGVGCSFHKKGDGPGGQHATSCVCSCSPTDGITRV